MSSRDQAQSIPYSFVPGIAEMRGSLSEYDPSQRMRLLEDQLPEYESGTPENPGEGYCDFELISDSFEQYDLQSSLLNQIDPIVKFRFQLEKYEETTAYVDGEFRTVHTRDVTTVNIFWGDWIILFQGVRSAASTAKRQLQRLLLDDLRITDEKLKPGIFLRLTGTELEENIESPQIEELLSVYAKGVDELSQIRITGKEGYDVHEDNIYDEYLPEHGEISSLILNFNFSGYKIVASISYDLIRIYSISGSEELEQSEELTVAIVFAKRIIEIDQASKIIDRTPE